MNYIRQSAKKQKTSGVIHHICAIYKFLGVCVQQLKKKFCQFNQFNQVNL